MNRYGLSSLLASLCVGVAIGDDSPAPSPPRMMVPDRSWSAAPGGHATIHPGEAPSLPTRYAFDEFEKFTDANDAVGIKGLKERGLVTMLEGGTPVLIIAIHGRASFAPSGPMSGADFGRRQQDAILQGSGRPAVHPSAEVRVLAGPLKDTVRFVDPESLASLIEKVLPAAKRAKPAPRPIDPASRAATLLQAARNLQKAGKSKAAIDDYRRIIRDFPATTASDLAKAELKALRVRDEGPAIRAPAPR